MSVMLPQPGEQFKWSMVLQLSLWKNQSMKFHKSKYHTAKNRFEWISTTQDRSIIRNTLTTSWSLMSSSSIDIIGCWIIGIPGLLPSNAQWDLGEDTALKLSRRLCDAINKIVMIVRRKKKQEWAPFHFLEQTMDDFNWSNRTIKILKHQ